MNIWYLTDNHQIINLEYMQCFWIEDLDQHREENPFHVFSKDINEVEWRLGEYPTFFKAQQIIEKIYLQLHPQPFDNNA